MVILVEGRTEARFVEDLLQPYLNPKNDPLGPWLTARIVETSRTAAGLRSSGGGGRWLHYHQDLQKLLKGPHWSRVGLLLDYYAYPRDAPGVASAGNARVRHAAILEALQQHYPDPRFVPGLALHEFETWVLAAAVRTGSLLKNVKAAQELHNIVAKCGGDVEMVNDSPNTAPSKRLAHAFLGYSKTVDGISAISDAGLDAVVASCPALADWLRRLTASDS